MKNTKLTRFLMLFTKEEFKKFGLFVSSPYFNKLNNVTALFQALKKHHPDFQGKSFTRENIHKKIFPAQEYNDIKMRALFSYLLSLAEKFLAVERYLENNSEVTLDISKALKKKEESYFSKKNIEAAALLLNTYKTRDADYYYLLSKVLFEKNTSTSHFARSWDIQKEADSLTVYFIVTILTAYAAAFHRKNLLHTELRTGLLESVTALALKDPYKRIPAVRMNYALYMMARYNEEEKYFYESVRLIDKYPSVLSKDDVREVYAMLLTFCVLKIQKGKKEFIKIKFELYKKMFSENLIEIENRSSLVSYNNMVSSALENNDDNFAESFIEEYKEKLHTETRKDTVELSYAKLYYSRKNYNKALEHLSKTGNDENIFYKLAIKDLNIKILYEMEAYEPIFSIIDSYKHFLYNNTIISDDLKKKYRLYLNYLGELLKIKINPDKNKQGELKNILTPASGFVHKDWILEKLNEILIK